MHNRNASTQTSQERDMRLDAETNPWSEPSLLVAEASAAPVATISTLALLSAAVRHWRYANRMERLLLSAPLSISALNSEMWYCSRDHPASRQ